MLWAAGLIQLVYVVIPDMVITAPASISVTNEAGHIVYGCHYYLSALELTSAVYNSDQSFHTFIKCQYGIECIWHSVCMK